MKQMKIDKDAMVELQYVLKSGNNGELIEQTSEDNPLEFIFGQGMMLESFENNLRGLTAGDAFDFKLTPEQAYGEFSEEAIQDLDIAIFKGQDGKVDYEVIKEGNVVPLMTQDGHRLQAVVTAVGEETVKMDFNHPLAGETLHFTGTVSLVRPATEAELNPHHGCGCSGHGHEHKDGECCGEGHGGGECCGEGNNHGDCGCH